MFLPCVTAMPGAFVSVYLEDPPSNPLSICEAFVYTDQGKCVSDIIIRINNCFCAFVTLIWKHPQVLFLDFVKSVNVRKVLP